MKTVKEPPKTKGKSGKFTVPTGETYKFTIVDEVSITREYKERGKINRYHKLIQVIQYDDGDYGFRFGYYRYNPEKDRWVWGQFTKIINPEEWDELYKKAKKKNFFTKYRKR